MEFRPDELYFEGDFLMLMTEFDLISEHIRNELTNKTQRNFTRATADSIIRILFILAEASNYNKVRLSQLEMSSRLSLSQNRVSELLQLTKKIGLISIVMICRCGNVRNEYRLLDGPIVDTIKNSVLKKLEKR